MPCTRSTGGDRIKLSQYKCSSNSNCFSDSHPQHACAAATKAQLALSDFSSIPDPPPEVFCPGHPAHADWETSDDVIVLLSNSEVVNLANGQQRHFCAMTFLATEVTAAYALCMRKRE